ncbi:hypothetical protein IWW43_002510 [Coemansia sp. RSA 1935]|nr:hypothetical protein IWW43_002510 [Coemansia sp. RSA 1935]
MTSSYEKDIAPHEQPAGSGSGSNTNTGHGPPNSDVLTSILQTLTANQDMLFKELVAGRKEQAASQERLFKEQADRQDELADRQDVQATARQEAQIAREEARAARQEAQATAREEAQIAREEERFAKQEIQATARQEAQTAELRNLVGQGTMPKRVLSSVRTGNSPALAPNFIGSGSMQSASIIHTPVKSNTQLYSVDSTPFTRSAPLKTPNYAAYKALSGLYDSNVSADNLQSILVQLGGDWSAEWQKALDGKYIFAEDSIWSIIGDGTRTYIAGQDIECSLLARGMSQKLRWTDTHATSIEDGRMPDGLIHICGPGINPDWRSVVVAFEVMSDTCEQDETNILGRQLWSFIAMAKNQPRRFTLGFSVSQNGEVYVYFCTAEKVRYAKIGVLPYCTKDRAQVTKAVRFLLLVYMQLPKDTGILMHKDGNIPETFRAQDILHGRSIDSVSDLSDMEITILNGKARSGRREALFGPRSWIFDASVKSATETANHILKFHWHNDNSSEVFVHAKVEEFKVPHTPQLVGAIAIPARDEESMAGEMILLDDAGKDIYTFFKNLRLANSYQMTDMFAGYFHALLAAATGDGRKFVLHRDVSARNLLVKNIQPFLIDWGCGIVADIDIPRVASSYAKVGTAPFMGLRVLSECSNRSLIDDLESLFLVFAHCLWLRYGTIPAEDKKYWDGTAPTNELINFRICWLLCESSFIKNMKLENCPEELRNLATAMYGLVYPLSKVALYNIYKDATDPRLATFNAHEWVAAFDTVAASSKSANITRVNLERLREYVENTPECNTPQVDRVLLQPALNSGGKGKEPEIAISLSSLQLGQIPEEPVSPSPLERGKNTSQAYNLRSKKDDIEAASALSGLKAKRGDRDDQAGPDAGESSNQPKRTRK